MRSSLIEGIARPVLKGEVSTLDLNPEDVPTVVEG
jgi:hypothetical protein